MPCGFYLDDDPGELFEFRFGAHSHHEGVSCSVRIWTMEHAETDLGRGGYGVPSRLDPAAASLSENDKLAQATDSRGRNVVRVKAGHDGHHADVGVWSSSL